MKKILLICVIVMSIASNCFAAKIERDATVAVMDFGVHTGAVPFDISAFNAGKIAHEYILQQLLESNKFTIMDKYVVEEKIQAENLNTTGLIDQDTARRIGEMLGVKYIIYGNVNDVTLSDVGTKVAFAGVTVCTVQSHIIARIMNVETGDIIAMSKGEGKCKSSYVKAKGGPVMLLEIGTKKVSQDSVHNALEKAATQTVDILVERLYNAQ